MAVIFPRWMNRIPLLVGVGVPAGLVAIIGGMYYWFSPKYTDVGYTPDQPVAFSHKLHASELGMDCRYCHNTVERAAKAAIPPTATCMNCHAIIGKELKSLALVRESAATGASIPWVRVHMLPDYAFFDHSVHLAAGVGCTSCHGRVDLMRTVGQQEPLSMSWCLECHRNPTPHLRPRQEVTNMAWDTTKAKYDAFADASRARQPNPPISCSGCHR